MNADAPFGVEIAEAREALRGRTNVLKSLSHAGLTIEVRKSASDLWLAFRRGRKGGVALRVPLFLEGARIEFGVQENALLSLRVENSLGCFDMKLRGDAAGIAHFRWRVDLTPRSPVHIPYFPRDLVAFGARGDPAASQGVVEAEQRRLNTGLCYFRFEEPDLGKVLYVQNLTALNAYYAATGTKPEGAVGGKWPLLGYLAPTQAGDPETTLPAKRRCTLFDTRLVFRSKPEESETESAWQFLDMQASIYRDLDRPAPQRRDWIGRAERTLEDLSTSPKARETHYGHRYFHPYTCAEHPDSMVQLALLTAIQDWGRWTGAAHPLADRIARGMAKFYDPKLKTLRRYLPDVGDDKDPDAVDSWYMYHPLLNLSNVALNGEAWARKLFLKSIGYGIKAARHFDHKWPIQYKIDSFAIITPVTKADNRGQTDVGGIYAWLMLQAFELTAEAKYLEEAKAAIRAAKGMRFELNYQANLTAWGAAACIRLWRITSDKAFLAQSYVYLASFFHNTQLWESEIGHARHYSIFMGVTALQDAPYMAMYESYDSFAAFERYLDLGGPDLLPAAKLLVTEYCRYALHGAWFYYPDALPEEALAPEQRNGEIDPKLSFPLEDLYPDGQPAGQVGQEIYGAGAAMIFATRAFHRIEGAPFVLFCDHFARAFTRLDDRTVSFTLDGDDTIAAEVALLPVGRRQLPDVTLQTAGGRVFSADRQCDGYVRFKVSANSALLLSW